MREGEILVFFYTFFYVLLLCNWTPIYTNFWNTLKGKQVMVTNCDQLKIKITNCDQLKITMIYCDQLNNYDTLRPIRNMDDK